MSPLPFVFPAVILVLSLLVTMAGLKGKGGMIAIGLLLLVLRLAGLIVLVVGATRLAKPWSTWTRWCYDDATTHLAARRFGGTEDVLPPVWPGGHPPEPPRCAVLADRLLLATVLTSLVVAPGIAVVGGVLVPYARLARSGRRSSRTVVTWLAGTGGLLQLVFTVSSAVLGRTPWSWNTVAFAVLGVLAICMLGQGVRLLHDPEVDSYLTTDALARR